MAAFVLFVVDGTMLFRSHSDLRNSILRVDDALATPQVVRLQINARQWAWDIRYAGIDGRFDSDDDIFRVSEIVLPQDRPVVFELAASDVIHSLYLPNFRIKQDAIPGRVVRGWFQPTRLGRYDIACAQHCGVHHFQMGGTLHVVSQQEFTRWKHDMSLSASRFANEHRRVMREEKPKNYQGKRSWWSWGTP